MKAELNSNKLNSDIQQVCGECGIAANVLTCLYRYGEPPKQLAFTVSTYHTGKCDWCGQKKPVTEVRDFFYPDFSHLLRAREIWERDRQRVALGDGSVRCCDNGDMGEEHKCLRRTRRKRR